MKDLFYKRLANILTIKSLVTLILTAVFAVMTVQGTLEQPFLTIYTVIISFYFGTQAAARKEGGE